MDDSPSTPPRIAMTAVRRRFGRVDVLRGVDLAAFAGEMHVLAGANGAGKSTLLRILSGALAPHAGRIELDGRTVAPRSPHEAAELGIAMIHQELSLVGSMSVADNILLGVEPRRCWCLRRNEIRRRVDAALGLIGLDGLDSSTLVGELPLATQQLVEIAKAVGRSARVLILDEPTSALPAPAAERLFELLGDLKRRGCAILYVTHRMAEIDRLADRVTVLRDGLVAACGVAGAFTHESIVAAMLGRRIERATAPPGTAPDRPRLEVRSRSVRTGRLGAVENVSFAVGEGEILGIAGMPGCGAAALVASLYGACDAACGEVCLDGAPIRVTSPRHASALGIAYVPGDRKTSALVPALSVEGNLTLACVERLARAGWRSQASERRNAENMAAQVRLTGATLDAAVSALSGGNQQKTVVGRCLMRRPRVLLCDEPTRGIDVGARQDLYDLLRSFAASGMTVVFTSTDLDEVLELSDRILVLHRGRSQGLFPRAAASPESLLAACMGAVSAGQAA